MIRIPRLLISQYGLLNAVGCILVRLGGFLYAKIVRSHYLLSPSLSPPPIFSASSFHCRPFEGPPLLPTIFPVFHACQGLILRSTVFPLTGRPAQPAVDLLT